MALVPPVHPAQYSPVHRPVQLSRQQGRLPQTDSSAADGARWEERSAHQGTRAGDGRGEKAAKLRDEIAALKSLGLRGDVDKDVQPEVFHIEPRKGSIGLRKVLGLSQTPRTIEGIDIAHLAGDEMVASLVAFIDGLPFKPSYRRYKIKSVEGVDDFASIREVVFRRFRDVGKPSAEEERVFPDILLIDGGKGQLNAALDVFRLLGKEPPCLISLAKQQEEIYRPGEAEPLRLSRHSAALRLLQYVRDEAHRFAQHYHHQLRRKKYEQ